MFSLKLSLLAVFLVWAVGSHAAPAVHRHRAVHAQLMHRHHIKSQMPVPAPHVLFEAQEKPNNSSPPQVLHGDHDLDRPPPRRTLRFERSLISVNILGIARVDWSTAALQRSFTPAKAPASQYEAFDSLDARYRPPRCDNMPSPRRVRLLMLAGLATFFFVLFYTSGFDSSHDAELRNSQGFVQKTKDAMKGAPPPGEAVLDSQTGQKAGHIPADKDADGDVDEDDREMAAGMQERLKAAEKQAKEKANEKGGMRPDPPRQVIGVGSSADGQKDEEAKRAGNGAEAIVKVETKEKEPEESKEMREAATELASILKKSPMVIFSKSYCPFSKRAKGLLLEKYSITPEPYVVELDKHPLTTYMQNQLEKKTGRRTVPNIMVNGVSIGGADDVLDLDKSDSLVSKILQYGGGKIEIAERFVTGGSVH
ncbi:hypothetical protein AK830_g10468 [Neonectria ditissima]|uniref:Glutaredoxin domain-containing protein n=1 Tax=Neonectria ditissima TaxID=78410 RepID=A0A0P7AFQ3_9HYPO|nr:hypothetical protein AK830_g10468 [Neonectria ditissima]